MALDASLSSVISLSFLLNLVIEGAAGEANEHKNSFTTHRAALFLAFSNGAMADQRTWNNAVPGASDKTTIDDNGAAPIITSTPAESIPKPEIVGNSAKASPVARS